MLLNIRFIIKMLGMMCILETLFMLMATVVAFLYKGGDFYPLLISSGILFGVGISLYAIGFRANEYTAGRREGDADGYAYLVAALVAGNVAFLFGRIYRQYNGCFL